MFTEKEKLERAVREGDEDAIARLARLEDRHAPKAVCIAFSFRKPSAIHICTEFNYGWLQLWTACGNMTRPEYVRQTGILAPTCKSCRKSNFWKKGEDTGSDINAVSVAEIHALRNLQKLQWWTPGRAKGTIDHHALEGVLRGFRKDRPDNYNEWLYDYWLSSIESWMPDYQGRKSKKLRDKAFEHLSKPIEEHWSV